MAAEDLFQQGCQAEGAGDLNTAIEVYREAADAGHAQAAHRLGWALRNTGDFPAAEDAFRLAEGLGDTEACGSLGSLLFDLGDTSGAEAAFLRCIAAGSAHGELSLGLVYADQRRPEALPLLRRAEAKGMVDASCAIGRLLQDEGDLWGAEEAYRRAAELGSTDGAAGLGFVLTQFGDFPEARAAYALAKSRGHERVGEIFQELDQLLQNAELEGHMQSDVAAGAEPVTEAERLYTSALEAASRRDKEGALRLMSQAAESGHFAALIAACTLSKELGYSAKRCKWAQAAAATGRAEGWFQLGLCEFDAGNTSAARELLVRAMQEGHESAESVLSKLSL